MKISLLLFLFSTVVHATVLLPKDYESHKNFIKITKTQVSKKSIYTFYECKGDLKEAHCAVIFNPAGYTKLELKSIKDAEFLKAGLLLTAEVVTGGIIWKRLMRFTLTHSANLVRKFTGWSDDVAVGTMALVIAAPTNGAITVTILDAANDALTMIDPFDRYHKSKILNTNKYTKDAIINLKYGFDQSFLVLRELLSRVES